MKAQRRKSSSKTAVVEQVVGRPKPLYNTAPAPDQTCQLAGPMLTRLAGSLVVHYLAVARPTGAAPWRRAKASIDRFEGAGRAMAGGI